MQLTHAIALSPTGEQERYFRQARGTARWCWNWALAEWNRQYDAGERPTAAGLKKQFNAVKYQQFPWLAAIHRDAHAQPFTHLARAWSRYFAARRAGGVPAPEDPIERRRLRRAGVKLAYPPTFKKKGQTRDSFYVTNDKFALSQPGGSTLTGAANLRDPSNQAGPTIRLPKVGVVRMTEALRFPGKVLGATITRVADRWSVAIQVDVPDQVARRRRTADGIEGVDLGITAAVTLASGETIRSPKPLRAGCGSAPGASPANWRPPSGGSASPRAPASPRGPGCPPHTSVGRQATDWPRPTRGWPISGPTSPTS